LDGNEWLLFRLDLGEGDGVSDLGSLKKDLDYWNGQVNVLNDKIKKLKKRKGEVEGINSAFQSTVNNNISDINAKVRLARDKLDGAIDYPGKDATLDAILYGKEERTIGSDGNLTSANGELGREIKDINRQIDDAEGSLATAKYRVSDTKDAIATEERYQREEATRKAAEEARKAAEEAAVIKTKLEG